MAEILVLRGITEVKSKVGTRLNRAQSSEGDTFPILKWWDKSDHADYVPCIKITVDRIKGDLNLFVPASDDAELTIEFDGDNTLTFNNYRAVRRIGIQLAPDDPIAGEYVFPKIDSTPIFLNIEPGLPVQGFNQYYQYHKKIMEEFNQLFISMNAGDDSTVVDICDLNAGDDSFDLNQTHNNG